MEPSIDDPHLPLSRLFDLWPEVGHVFLDARTLCFGCPIAPFHTVLDACREHRLDEEAFRLLLRAEVG